jgi:uncharacterized membrane protein YkoI
MWMGMDLQKARRVVEPLWIAVLLCMAGFWAAHADDDHGARPTRSAIVKVDEDQRASPQDLAEALKRGDILPLDDVLGAVRSRFPGEIIEVESEKHGSRWIYEVTVLGNDGRRRRIIIDARSLDITESEE